MATTLENSNFVQLTLKLFGYFRTPALNVLYTGAYLFLGFLLILGEFIGLVNRTSVQEQMEAIFYMGAVLYFLLSYLAIRHKCGQLLEFVAIISKPTDINDDLRSVALQSTIEKAAAVIPTFLAIFACLTAFSAFSWCVTLLLSEFDYGNKNYYLGSFMYQCGDGGENRFPLKSLCLNVNTLHEYVIVNTMYAVFLIWGSSVYAWEMVFFICFRIFLGKNLAVVKERLLQLQQRAPVADEFVRVYYDANCQKFLVSPNDKIAWKCEFVKIIQYHRYLSRIVKVIAPSLEIICSLLTVFYFVLHSMAAFLILNEVKTSGYWMFQMRIGGASINAAFVLMIFSYVSQVVSDMNQNIFNALYCMPWYVQTLSFQKMIFQFRTQLQKSFKIQSLGMLTMNLSLYTSILRLTYSAMNLMRTKFGHNMSK